MYLYKLLVSSEKCFVFDKYIFKINNNSKNKYITCTKKKKKQLALIETCSAMPTGRYNVASVCRF